ncbi:MAG: bifunctional phosphopantothenoylcysteine decarboxylase/phosphopantothenate--cysteine ligase CoaBC [Candidatus Firestonebacteria bacterium]|nr:bifunctional phosphopantothenoylcysteine decarboxylase/phosphopantothenate--cysteine ligase CoaBC [Candidatus Firestonebacteria bacterium]
MMSGRRVILGVCGGIAAYKAADLARRLTQEGCEVTTVMTANACRFVTPLTFRTLTGRPVVTEFFADPASPVPHISLAQAAELVVVAPATADCLARAAQGRADDLLAAVLLDTVAPILWAPAMNTRMWEHPLTQGNVKKLTDLGHAFVGPCAGVLACGDTGQGKLAPLEEIVAAVRAKLIPAGPLAGKRVLITAGPTREPWDAIRYLSNRSSGRMGYALAAEARRRGAEVTLVSGPVSLTPPLGVRTLAVTTAQEMHAQAMALFPETDIVIASAAVADFRPAAPSSQKIKKQDMQAHLELVPNPDILADMGRAKSRQVLVGFAAESDPNLESAALKKMKNKNLDLIVANAAGGEQDAFDAEQSAALLLDARGGRREFARQTKAGLAAEILQSLEAWLLTTPHA